MKHPNKKILKDKSEKEKIERENYYKEAAICPKCGADSGKYRPPVLVGVEPCKVPGSKLVYKCKCGCCWEVNCI